MYQLLNWIEALEALNQLAPDTRDEVSVFLGTKILAGSTAGDVDPLTGRSVLYEVRQGLLLHCDVDQVARTVDLLSIEMLVSKTNLA